MTDAAVARSDAYGASFLSPAVRFDGIDEVTGGGPDRYEVYEPIFLAHEAESSKVTVDADVWFDDVARTGFVRVTTTIAAGESLAGAGALAVRALVSLDHWERFGNPWQDMALLLPLEAPLAVTEGGSTQTDTLTFPIVPDSINPHYVTEPWDWAELGAIAFVQGDESAPFEILNAGLAAPTYDFAIAPVGPAQGSSSGGAVDLVAEVSFLGIAAADVLVTLDAGALPAGWSAVALRNSVPQPPTFTIPAMQPGQVETLTVRMTPDGPGPEAAYVDLGVTSAAEPNVATRTARRFHAFVDTPSILLVDDDNGEVGDVRFTEAIEAGGRFALVHDFEALGAPSAADLAPFEVVVWSTGSRQSSTIGASAQGSLIEYLDAGGSLFVSSRGFLNQHGASDPFAADYLKLAGFVLDAGAPAAVGVPGDPVGDGIAFSPEPAFADSADLVEPGVGATEWLVEPGASGGTDGLGIRHESGSYRTVFLGAAFEGVPGSDAALAMNRILTWLLDGDVVDVPPRAGPRTAGLSLAPNAPNPFFSSTRIGFTVPRPGPVRLAVYDVAGRRVADLVDGFVPAGPHAVVWDGTGATGGRVASGVYLVRLRAAGDVRTRRLVRLR